MDDAPKNSAHPTRKIEIVTEAIGIEDAQTMQPSTRVPLGLTFLRQARVADRSLIDHTGVHYRLATEAGILVLRAGSWHGRYPASYVLPEDDPTTKLTLQQRLLNREAANGYEYFRSNLASAATEASPVPPDEAVSLHRYVQNFARFKQRQHALSQPGIMPVKKQEAAPRPTGHPTKLRLV